MRGWQTVGGLLFIARSHDMQTRWKDSWCLPVRSGRWMSRWRHSLDALLEEISISVMQEAPLLQIYRKTPGGIVYKYQASVVELKMYLAKRPRRSSCVCRFFMLAFLLISTKIFLQILAAQLEFGIRWRHIGVCRTVSDQKIPTPERVTLKGNTYPILHDPKCTKYYFLPC